MQGRNRRCITVDMRQEEGRKLIKQLAGKVDVLVENFRPGVMEKWKLGPKVSLPQTMRPADCELMQLESKSVIIHPMFAHRSQYNNPENKQG